MKMLIQYFFYIISNQYNGLDNKIASITTKNESKVKLSNIFDEFN